MGRKLEALLDDYQLPDGFVGEDDGDLEACEKVGGEEVGLLIRLRRTPRPQPSQMPNLKLDWQCCCSPTALNSHLPARVT